VQLITLTTDFGMRDWFVGTMKGVIAGIAAQSRVIDLTHGICPGDIQGGAFSLMASCAFFAPGTIHVVVVDPGVGSERKPIAVKTAKYVFMGPDNGVLSWALRNEQVLETRVLENQRFLPERISHTFHGRDVFAPMAAHVAQGVPFESLGPSAETYVKLDWPVTTIEPGKVGGCIIHIDRFGNGITNIPNAAIGLNSSCGIETISEWSIPIKSFYGAVPSGSPVAVPGSTGYLEVAVNGGSAQETLHFKLGSLVFLHTEPNRAGKLNDATL
jgi:S-adenosyl-L-methionine hydrolase (adenosine-forming)